MNRNVVFPMFGSRESDFAVLPGGMGGRRRQSNQLPQGGAAVANYILLESGSGHIALESGSGAILLEH